MEAIELTFTEIGGATLAEPTAADFAIETPRDALDLIATAGFGGASHLLLRESQLPAAFFDLRTGLAGEILQKASNYRVAVVIVGEFDEYDSDSLRAFIAESNRGRQVAFVADRAAALRRIAG